MEELKKINSKIAKKQIGRLLLGIGSIIGGVILIERFSYQRGITNCQKSICEEFPDEYASMTDKVIESFKH